MCSFLLQNCNQGLHRIPILSFFVFQKKKKMKKKNKIKEKENNTNVKAQRVVH